jgi:hypothetical protein
MGESDPVALRSAEIWQSGKEEETVVEGHVGKKNKECHPVSVNCMPLTPASAGTPQVPPPSSLSLSECVTPAHALTGFSCPVCRSFLLVFPSFLLSISKVGPVLEVWPKCLLSHQAFELYLSS